MKQFSDKRLDWSAFIGFSGGTKMQILNHTMKNRYGRPPSIQLVLKFAKQNRSYGYYNTQHLSNQERQEFLYTFNKISYNEVVARFAALMVELDNYKKDHYKGFDGYLTSFTGQNYNEHVLFCDCDTKKDMNEANNYLQSQGIETYVIQSGGEQKESYWIIANYVDSIKGVIKVLRKVPGVDKRFVNYAEKRSCIFLRAFPKYFLPVFPENHVFATKNSYFETYCTTWKKYWETPFIQLLSNEMVSRMFDE